MLTNKPHMILDQTHQSTNNKVISIVKVHLEADAAKLYNSATMILASDKWQKYWTKVLLHRIFIIDLCSIRMCGMPKQSFSNQGIRMEPSRCWKKDNMRIFSLTTMLREMLGIIGFMLLMMLVDWLSYSEGRRSLSSSWTCFLRDVCTGPLSGCLIRTIGQGTSITYSLFGSLLLLIIQTSLPSIVGLSLISFMGLKGMAYLGMMIMVRCRHGSFLPP